MSTYTAPVPNPFPPPIPNPVPPPVPNPTAAFLPPGPPFGAPWPFLPPNFYGNPGYAYPGLPAAAAQPYQVPGAPPMWQSPPFPPPNYYLPPARTIEFRALGESEAAAVWLRAATRVFETNREPADAAALRATNALRTSGNRGMQIATAIESNLGSSTSWDAFSAAFTAAAGDDQQSLATARARLATFQAPTSAGAQNNINAFKSMINDLVAVSPTVADELASGGAQSTIARQLRKQYVHGFQETNKELFRELSKLDARELPIDNLYRATITFQTLKTEYGGWQYAATTPSQGSTSSDVSPTLNVAREPGAVIIAPQATARAAPVGNYSPSGQFQPMRAAANPTFRTFGNARTQPYGNSTWRPRNSAPAAAPQILATIGAATGANTTAPLNRCCQNCFVLGHFERDCTNATVPASEEVRRYVRVWNLPPPGWDSNPNYTLPAAIQAALDVEVRRRTVNSSRGGNARGNWRGNQGNHGNRGGQGQGQGGQGRYPVNALLSLSEGVQALQGYFEGSTGYEGSDGNIGNEGQDGYDDMEIQEDGDASYGYNAGLSEFQ